MLDVSEAEACRQAARGATQYYNLAADMGGIQLHRREQGGLLSVLINTHGLMAANEAGVQRYFYSSSACACANGEKQSEYSVIPLRESDAYPAMPEDGYGWEKLFSERMCRHFYEDFRFETRVARYHNVYGPFGTFSGRPGEGPRRSAGR